MAGGEGREFSRRAIVGDLAVGLPATAMSCSDVRASGSSQSSQEPLVDPTNKYPLPPFKRHAQPWPGLVSKMDPRPDHGETSYRGSSRLQGRRAWITGGDSGMGRAAAIAYAREGADVAINYLPSEEADAREVIQLIEEIGRTGIAIPGDLRDRAFCRRLVE